MRTILLFSLFFLISTTFNVKKASSVIDQSMVDISNQTILKIANSIERTAIPELKGFHALDMKKNDLGIYVMEYETEGDKGRLSFGITVSPIHNGYFLSKKTPGEKFSIKFPILGVELNGYQWGANKYNLDILKLTRKEGRGLWDYEQTMLPFELSLKATKENYSSGEDIEFIVKLKNNTYKIMMVKDLTAETLFFLYNEKPWGVGEVDKQAYRNIKTIKLLPGEAVQKVFRGGGFRHAQEIEIYGTYIMTYKDVKPEAVLKLTVK